MYSAIGDSPTGTGVVPGTKAVHKIVDPGPRMGAPAHAGDAEATRIGRWPGKAAQASLRPLLKPAAPAIVTDSRMTHGSRYSWRAGSPYRTSARTTAAAPSTATILGGEGKGLIRAFPLPIPHPADHVQADIGSRRRAIAGNWPSSAKILLEPSVPGARHARPHNPKATGSPSRDRLFCSMVPGRCSPALTARHPGPSPRRARPPGLAGPGRPGRQVNFLSWPGMRVEVEASRSAGDLHPDQVYFRPAGRPSCWTWSGALPGGRRQGHRGGRCASGRACCTGSRPA